MKFSEKIKHFRKKLNLTQTQLGKKVGVEQKQICRYENNESSPSVLVLQKLAKTFNVTVDFLLENTESQFIGEFNDMELFVYCQTIDKMPSEIRKSIKFILKMVALNYDSNDN